MKKSDVPKSLHERKLLKLIREYSKKNFDVFADYKNLKTPSMIGSYQPDLVVKKDNQEIIIEIVSRVDMQRAKDKLEYLSNYARQNKNVRFDIVLTNPKTSRRLNEDTKRFMLTSLRRNLLHNANCAYQRGQYCAAFYQYVNLLESLFEELASRENIQLEERSSLGILARELQNVKIINDADFKLVQQIMSERNRLAHFGFDKEFQINTDTLIELRRLSSAIMKNLL